MPHRVRAVLDLWELVIVEVSELVTQPLERRQARERAPLLVEVRLVEEPRCGGDVGETPPGREQRGGTLEPHDAGGLLG